jgi:7,8-dihydroneopterin aldolase/epimerase/oxygenase
MTDSPDLVLLEGLQFYGYHGVNPEERTLGQRFVVDVAIETDTREAAAGDDLAATVNYSAVFKAVRTIVEGPARQLIETLAGEIAAAVLADQPRATGVVVTVRKPQAPLKGGVFGAAGVRIRRERGE